MYKKILDIILILLVVAAAVTGGFYGYDYYKEYTTEKEAGEAAELFEKAIEDMIAEQVVVEEEPTSEEPSTPKPGGSGGGSGTTTVPLKYGGYNVLGVIKIKKINISYPILEENTINSLNKSVAKLYGGDLNEPGNVVISGHNNRNGRFFSNLHKVNIGDKIEIIDTKGRTVIYTVYSKYETTPEDTVYMTRNTEGKIEISLSTCNNDTTKRLIVLATAD